MSTSPILHGEHLILVLDNDANLPGSRLSQSKIVACDKTNGDDRLGNSASISPQWLVDPDDLGTQ